MDDEPNGDAQTKQKKMAASLEEEKTSSKSMSAKCMGQPTKNPKIRKSAYVGSSNKTKAATTTSNGTSSSGPISGHYG